MMLFDQNIFLLIEDLASALTTSLRHYWDFASAPYSSLQPSSLRPGDLRLSTVGLSAFVLSVYGSVFCVCWLSALRPDDLRLSSLRLIALRPDGLQLCTFVLPVGFELSCYLSARGPTPCGPTD